METSTKLKSHCPFCEYCCMNYHCNYTLEACLDNAEILRLFRESGEPNFQKFLEKLKNGK